MNEPTSVVPLKIQWVERQIIDTQSFLTMLHAKFLVYLVDKADRKVIEPQLKDSSRNNTYTTIIPVCTEYMWNSSSKKEKDRYACLKAYRWIRSRYMHPFFLIHYSNFSKSLPPCNPHLPPCFQFVNNVKHLRQSRLALSHALIMNPGSRHEQNWNNSVWGWWLNIYSCREADPPGRLSKMRML